MYNKKNFVKSICLILVVLMITAVAMVACTDKDAQNSADKANEAVATVDAKVAALEKKLTEASESIATVNTTAKTIETAVAEAKKSIEDGQKLITEAQGVLTTTATDVATNKAAITTMEGAIQSINASLETVVSNVTANKSSISALQASLKSDKAQIDKIEEAVNALVKSVEGLKETVEANVKSIQELEKAVKANETSLKQLIANAEKKAEDELKAAVAGLESSISKVDLKVSKNITDISDLKKTVDTLASAIGGTSATDISNSFTKLEQAVSALKEADAANYKKVEGLIGSLEEDYKAADKEAKKDYELQIKDLKTYADEKILANEKAIAELKEATEKAFDELILAFDSYKYDWLVEYKEEMLDYIVERVYTIEVEKEKITPAYIDETKGFVDTQVTPAVTKNIAGRYSTATRAGLIETLIKSIAEVAYAHEGADQAAGEKYIKDNIDTYISTMKTADKELIDLVEKVEADGKINKDDACYIADINAILADVDNKALDDETIILIKTNRTYLKTTQKYVDSGVDANTVEYRLKNNTESNQTKAGVYSRAKEDVQKIEYVIKLNEVAKIAKSMTAQNKKVLVVKTNTGISHVNEVLQESDYITDVLAYRASRDNMGITDTDYANLAGSIDNLTKGQSYATAYASNLKVFLASVNRYVQLRQSQTAADAVKLKLAAFVVRSYSFDEDADYYAKMQKAFGFDIAVAKGGTITGTGTGEYTESGVLGKWIKDYNIEIDHTKARVALDYLTGYAQENYEDVIGTDNIKTLEKIIAKMREDSKKNAEYEMVEAFLKIGTKYTDVQPDVAEGSTPNLNKIYNAIEKLEDLYDALGLVGDGRVNESLDKNHVVVIKHDGKYTAFNVKEYADYIKQALNRYNDLMKYIANFKAAFADLRLVDGKVETEIALNQAYKYLTLENDYYVIFDDATNTKVQGTIKGETEFKAALKVLKDNKVNAEFYAEENATYENLLRVIEINKNIDKIFSAVAERYLIVNADYDPDKIKVGNEYMTTFIAKYASLLLDQKGALDYVYDNAFFAGDKKVTADTDKAKSVTYDVNGWVEVWQNYIKQFVAEYFSKAEFRPQVHVKYVSTTGAVLYETDLKADESGRAFVMTSAIKAQLKVAVTEYTVKSVKTGLTVNVSTVSQTGDYVLATIANGHTLVVTVK